MGISKIIQIAEIILILCIVVFLSLTVSCKSFEPVWIKDLPPECNMSLNMMKLYYDSKDKSGAIPGTELCYKKLHRLNCQVETFGWRDDGVPNPVDYGDPKKYRDFSQCLAELK